MARDRNLVKRNLLALPGAVLSFYSLVGLVYVLGYRSAGICGDAHRFLVGGLCYNALPFLVALLLIGGLLLGLGLGLYRGRIEYAIDHLQAGTPTHMVATILGSLVVVLGVGAAVILYLENTQDGLVFATHIGRAGFRTSFLYEVGALVSLGLLVPMLGTMASQGARRRRFLRAAEEEQADADADYPGAPPRSTVPPEEFIEESSWPAAREVEVQNR